MPHLYIAKNWFLEQQALKGLITIDTHSLVSPAQAARLIICDAFFFIFNLGHKRGEDSVQGVPSGDRGNWE